MQDSENLLREALQKIHNRESFHIQIPKGNKLVFNRTVPYLFIYRTSGKKDPMLSELVTTEYAYLSAPDPDFTPEEWITPIAQKLADEFGSCLLVDAFIAEDKQENDIEVHIARKNVQSIAQYFVKHLQLANASISIQLISSQTLPIFGNTKPLLDLKHKKNDQVLYMGLSIRPTYLLQGKTDQILPILMRQYREALSKSLSKTFFEFVRIHTIAKPTEFKIVHQNELNPLVWEIDQKLARESQRFDFLLLITPVNTHEAWDEFKQDKYRRLPSFQYRPMPIDPDLIKRNLYNLRIEDLYDPTIADLYRDKRRELDAMMSMLSERGKEGFMLGSLQIFGNVGKKLLDQAKAILTITEDDKSHTPKTEDMVYADEFAEMARQEIQYLKQQNPAFDTTVRLRDDFYGVMVNQGVLNVSRQYHLPRNRAKALIQHEVGTHIVTYFNGKQQPFNLFRLGVPGYEKLQEGLAVLSEYLVDELTNERMRILAARVVAVDHMVAGNTFPDTFALLREQYQFDEATSFQITMRVYRSGGLTKDALYLQGLIELVNYIKEGHDITPLTIGKIRKDYIPIVKELMLKGIVKPPALTPRYLEAEYLQKLEPLRRSSGIFKMIQ